MMCIVLCIVLLKPSFKIEAKLKHTSFSLICAAVKTGALILIAKC